MQPKAKLTLIEGLARELAERYHSTFKKSEINPSDIAMMFTAAAAMTARRAVHDFGPEAGRRAAHTARETLNIAIEDYKLG